jgi:FAD/FMN-containing dehydrogenase
MRQESGTRYPLASSYANFGQARQTFVEDSYFGGGQVGETGALCIAREQHTIFGFVEEKQMAHPQAGIAALATLRSTFAGTVLQPGDNEYDAVRALHNGLIDKRPAVIARCRNEADIAASITFAREHKLEIAVRGGGHNVSGRASVEGGMMIDLSLMKAIEVNPTIRRAVAQGGVLWGEFNRATQQHGLATTGGVISTTGISGLTLGGGFGYLSGKHGLATDNLVAATLVTAEGKTVRASDSENPDLYWALRGGGGNFGVVSSLEYSLHPVGPTIMAGAIAWPLSQAREVLRLYREFTDSAPDEVACLGGVGHAPDGSGVKVAIIGVSHCGPLADGERILRPIKQFGSPLFDTIQPTGYCDLNGMFDIAYPKGMLNYWKSSFLTAVDDSPLNTIVDMVEHCPSKYSGIFLEHWHGAVARVPEDHTAFHHRREGHNLLILSQWQDAAATEENIAWARYGFARLEPFFAKARYVNYMDQDDGGDVAGPFGGNYARLAQIKARWDPDNVFHLNQNIRPAIG